MSLSKGKLFLMPGVDVGRLADLDPQPVLEVSMDLLGERGADGFIVDEVIPLCCHLGGRALRASRLVELPGGVVGG